ncbi:hypothetical protein I3F58_28090 [Streptomyces sp. MUM 203J]|uniref:hypothetical protein n=1 Tax=Streptomyces sp. MUM 203J TaxID=2791990 RepID=UPI001F035BB1|nr:hypothetical protein [Streptomyces sp. MUM 203J]MCH0543340.1 hypothetical protein [Streptomyces sp. MUM 203J]
MGHIPVFRWILALGLGLIGCSAGLYAAAPHFPELKQVELTVLEEEPDGACTVRWTDPYEHREREAPYLCDAGRAALLKAPHYDTGSGFGWDSGFVVAEGPDKGELYSLEEDGGSDDWWIETSDALVLAGLLLAFVGLVGGNIRALSRALGVAPAVIRRAELLRAAAVSVTQDHERAVEAVLTAWEPMHRDLVDARLGLVPVAGLRCAAGARLPAEELEAAGIHTARDVLDAREWGLVRCGVTRRTAERAVAAARRVADEAGEDVAVRLDADLLEPHVTTLLVALRVLVEAGPQARSAAGTGAALAARLEPLLAGAAPASGLGRIMAAGPGQRRRAQAAVAELRLLVDGAERDGLPGRFAQASVDLLRASGGDSAGLSAQVDFEARPVEYYALLDGVRAAALSQHR